MGSRLITYLVIIIFTIIFNRYFKRRIESLIRREVADKGGIVTNIKPISRDNIYVVTCEIDGEEVKTTIRYLGEGILEWLN